MEKVIIGCEEWLSIKDLNIPIIKARVDSGAKTSSLQAKNIKKIIRKGEAWVTYDVCPIQDNLSYIFHVNPKLSIQELLRVQQESPKKDLL